MSEPAGEEPARRATVGDPLTEHEEWRVSMIGVIEKLVLGDLSGAVRMMMERGKTHGLPDSLVADLYALGALVGSIFQREAPPGLQARVAGIVPGEPEKDLDGPDAWARMTLVLAANQESAALHRLEGAYMRAHDEEEAGTADRTHRDFCLRAMGEYLTLVGSKLRATPREWIHQFLSAAVSYEEEWSGPGSDPSGRDMPHGVILHNVHPQSDCENFPCILHHPSDHHMVEWPIYYDGARRLFVRICPCHGTPHPDPDSAGYVLRARGQDVREHVCPGCCTPGGLSDEAVADMERALREMDT